jgi:hypothetical protein
MITILSYCDTTDKKERLSFLISELKKRYNDQKILVYSHYRNLEPKYYSLADYYIFDHTNPTVNKILGDWVAIESQKKKFYRWGEDWGFAVLQMIKRSSFFIKSISSEGCLFLNYDSDPYGFESLNFFEMAERLEDSQIGIFCPWGPETQISLTCFYLDLPKIKNSFFEKITADAYVGFPCTLTPEGIFKLLVDEEFSGRYLMSEGISPQVSSVDRGVPFGCQLHNYFNTILPTRNNLPGDERKCLAAWNCKERINLMGIEIEGNNYTIHNEISGENGDISFFAHLPDVSKVEEIKIVLVNGIEIDPPYLIENLDPGYWSRNYHEEY